MSYLKERETALNAVIKASLLCIDVQKNLISKDSIKKEDKSPVTIADFGSQAIVNHILSNSFDYPIAGEEDSSYLGSTEGEALKLRIIEKVNEFLPGNSQHDILDYIDKGNYGGGKGKFWTLDPIDGTKGFLRNEQYAVALALIEEGEVVLGVLGCPNLMAEFNNKQENIGCLLIAEKGKGAFIRNYDNDEEIKINVSNISDITKASFCESVESSHSSHNDSEKIAELLGVKSEPVRIDSQCKYAVLARGDASIYLRLPTGKNYEEKIWDHAAGYIILKEAGGEVTDCNGRPLDFSLGTTLKANTGIVATNGRFHKEILDAVSKVLS
ncbi:MAG: 3'(2'),5'-bisphosphate nucleotidase [Thermodesulfobacteriota bacterium]